jgi:hypothetical protein
MNIPDAGLHVVAVGPFLILALDTEKLDPAKHGQATETHVTVLVAHLASRADRQGSRRRCYHRPAALVGASRCRFQAPSPGWTTCGVCGASTESL